VWLIVNHSLPWAGETSSDIVQWHQRFSASSPLSRLLIDCNFEFAFDVDFAFWSRDETRRVERGKQAENEILLVDLLSSHQPPSTWFCFTSISLHSQHSLDNASGNIFGKNTRLTIGLINYATSSQRLKLFNCAKSKTVPRQSSIVIFNSWLCWPRVLLASRSEVNWKRCWKKKRNVNRRWKKNVKNQ
jgi:hypothetical protein